MSEKKIETKIAEPTNPSVREITEPQVNPNNNFTHNPGYVKKSRGFPVELGQTWHHLTPAQRRQWFEAHESRWKQRFGIENRGQQANMNWTRG